MKLIRKNPPQRHGFESLAQRGRRTTKCCATPPRIGAHQACQSQRREGLLANNPFLFRPDGFQCPEVVVQEPISSG